MIGPPLGPGPSGGPITKDNTGVEYYCTIFAACESLHDDKTIWCGSDDGLIHITRDSGESWADVTPPDMPEWMQINSIEPHPTEAGGLYVAGTRYKLDDFKPYLYQTLDFGKSWKRIDKGIDAKHFTRVVRADAQRPGLLYAGTENGLYVSFDDGKQWQTFQCNLPTVPVTDLALKNNDLIVATQGRSFWMLDDVSILQQWKPELAKKPLHIFPTRPVHRMRAGRGRSGRTSGANIAGGVPIKFFLENKIGEKQIGRVEILNSDDEVVRVFSTKPDRDENELKLTMDQGMNTLTWDMRHAGAETFSGLILWGGGTTGPMALPGDYTAKFTIADKSKKANSEKNSDDDESDDESETDNADEESAGNGDDASEEELANDGSDENEMVSAQLKFSIVKDQRSSASQEDLQAQFDFLIDVRDKLTQTHKTIKRLRDVKQQIESITKRLGDKEEKDDFKEIIKMGKQVVKQLSEGEKTLYQTKNRTNQDPLNFPIQLNNRLSALVSVVSRGDNRPTDQAYAVRDELKVLIDEAIAKLDEAMESGVSDFNEAFRKAEIPAVFVDE